MAKSETKDYISASEIGTFSYCERAYWLKTRGEKQVISKQMRQGSKEHAELSKKVETVQVGQAKSRLGFVVAALLAGLALLLLFLAVVL